jgi:hypothetical protein
MSIAEPMNDATGRTEEIKKIQRFAGIHDLAVEWANTQDGVYEGSMGVRSARFITQYVGGKKIVVHEMARLGDKIAPGQKLRIDYSAMTRVTWLGPTRTGRT